ncbi:MAG: hypothetical protein AAGJ80_07655, partial [Cyanobacteria bacterium J06553_1]
MLSCFQNAFPFKKKALTQKSDHSHQDVTVTVSLPSASANVLEFDLEQYAAPTVGPDVAASIMTISNICSTLPVWDDR